MSEIAKAPAADVEQIAVEEFSSASFADKRALVLKVRALSEMLCRALIDNVEEMTDRPLDVEFRPSTTKLPQYTAWVPCYFIGDDERKPVRQRVEIGDVNPNNQSVEFVEWRQIPTPEEPQRWKVKLLNILSIEEATFDDEALTTGTAENE